MPVPKRKKSKSKQGMRRSHRKIKTPRVSLCGRCKTPKLPHRVCNQCGYYKEKDILRIEEQF